jgi:nucleoside-diphosphate-sugar epimerase
VIGSARSPDKAERLRRLGAESVVLDALDARVVREALAAAQPDAVVHQATALTGISDFKDFDRTFAQTNRLLWGAQTRSCANQVFFDTGSDIRRA